MTFVRSAPLSVPFRRRRARGFSLVELLVALLIGLILTLAMSSALVVGESHKRTTGAGTEMDQSGAYAASIIDTLVRSAGSGLMQSTSAGAGLLGCRLNAGAGSSALPASSLPAPFDHFLGGRPGDLRVAPVLIAKNQSGANSDSDVLVVMSGSGAAGGISRPVNAAGDSTTVNLANTVGIHANDLVLMSVPGNTDCIVEPVGSVTTTSLMLSGAGYAEGPGNLAGTLSANGYVTPLGSRQGGDAQFQLLGVGDKNMLYSYDLLNAINGGSAKGQAIASDVYAMHALYGLDTTGGGKLTAWVDPGATGYDITSMMTDPNKLKQIVAIRVALVLKSSLYEKQAIPGPALNWFQDGLSTGVANIGVEPQTLTPEDTHYRYRVIEFVVPVRNNLI